MRGVADEREPLADERTRDEIAKRESTRFVEHRDLAKMQAKAPFKFAVKFRFAESRDARRFGAFLGPDQRGALSGQRQDRERAGRQEMFFGAAMMVALMADRDHNAGLIVVPAMGGDPGTLAQLRPRAVSGHEQARLDRAAVRQRDIDAVAARDKIGHRKAAKIDALGLGALDQRIDQMTVLDHMREWLTRLDIACKCQENRPGSVFELGVGNDHIQNRLRSICNLFPDANGIEQPPAGGDDGGSTRIAARPQPKRRIGDDNGNIGAKALTQRQRQRQPCKPAAADDNASLYRHTGPAHPHYCHWSIAGRNKGAKQGSFFAPAVIRGPILRFRLPDFGFQRFAAPEMTKESKALPCPKASSI